MFQFIITFILASLTIVFGASNGQDITNRFLDVIKDPQTEIQLKTLYCTKFKIQNCESSFNQIKQELLDSFKNNSQKSPIKNVKRKTVIALEGGRRRNDNGLAALIPLLALLGNNNNEDLPILPSPQRQSNIDLSLLQQPQNPQPITCCSQPALLQPLQKLVSIAQSYTFYSTTVLNVGDSKISCPQIDTQICLVPSLISIQNVGLSGDLPPNSVAVPARAAVAAVAAVAANPAANPPVLAVAAVDAVAARRAIPAGSCAFPANPTGIVSSICNGRTDCDINSSILIQLLTLSCQIALNQENAAFTTSAGSDNVAVPHLLQINIQYQCVNTCQFQQG